jgi:hypothetical protein
LHLAETQYIRGQFPVGSKSGSEKEKEFMKKTGLLIITLAAFSVGAMAQLGGVVRSTTGAAGSAQGSRGGLAGDLGVDHTLNGTLGAGRNSVDLGADSTVNGTVKADKVRESAKQTQGNSKQAGADASAKTKQRVATTAQRTEEKIEQAPSAASVSTSTNAKANGRASEHGPDASTHAGLDLGNAADAAVGGHEVQVDSNARANASADMKHKHLDPSESESGNASAENSNSGDTKLHGLDRAESRVENNTTAESMLQRNQQRQEGNVKVFSDTKGSAKVTKSKKRD